MGRGFSLLLGLAIAGSSACGSEVCTLPGCPAENLVVTTYSRCWPDGTYEVRATLDGEAVSVTFALPGGGASSPDGRVAVQASDARGVEAIAITGTPARVELQLFHEGVGVGTRRFEAIRYEDRLVGGGDCEPTNCGPGAAEVFRLDDAAAGALCAVDAGGEAP